MEYYAIRELKFVAVTEHNTLDQGFCSRFRVCPDNSGSGRMWISDQTDIAILSFVHKSLVTGIVPIRVSDAELDSRIASYFGIESGPRSPNHREPGQDTIQDQIVSDSQIVRDINTIISDCIYSRTSDIHFEPREKELICRKRIDGILIEHRRIPSESQAEMISRIKIMAGLDIAEKRRPQDGRIRFPIDGRSVDIRVSVIPTDFGEKAVLRLLDKESLRLDLGDLGFTTGQLALFRDRISVKNGIILVTGPTGSGKTTTLYAALQHLKSPDVNISTVEDPIEYNLAGVNQTQVQPEIGRTFAAMLRAMLRQDPDIIMIGEIRDRETLDIAIRASLTGHIVLSTIHTNSAVATVPRLLDMGAEPYLLASCLKLIVAQRLVRRLCTDCLSTAFDDTYTASAHKLSIDLDPQARSSTGCKVCNQSGYRGRTAIYEMLSVDDKLSQAITSKATELELLTMARQSGFLTMADTASGLVNEGITSPTEILRELSA